MGYGRTVTISTRRAMKIMLDRLAELEDGQVHRDHHAADHHAEHYHDHRFHQTGQRVDRIVDLGLEEVGDLAEHGIEGSGFLPDRHHLSDHVGKDVGFLHRRRQARPGAHLPLDLPGGHQVDVISRSAADRVQRAMVDFLIRSPKTGSLSIVRSMNIWTGKERFHSARKPHTLPMTAGKMMYQYLTKASEIPMTNKVGAGRSAPKFVNTSLNAGITKIMMTAVMMNATTMIAIG